MKELFLGRFRLELVHPFPDDRARNPGPSSSSSSNKLKKFLRRAMSIPEIDATGEYPARADRRAEATRVPSG